MINLKNYLVENYNKYKTKLKPTCVSSNNVKWKINIERLCELTPQALHLRRYPNKVDNKIAKLLADYCFESKDLDTTLELLNNLLDISSNEFKALHQYMCNTVMDIYFITDETDIDKLSDYISILIRCYVTEKKTELDKLIIK